ncbi:MAG: hypothetical protein Tsb007_07520 [Rhizobacter sp.]
MSNRPRLAKGGFRWHKAKPLQQAPVTTPFFLWHSPYLSTQGFANFLQFVIIVLTAWSFIVYFKPEQQLKRTEQALVDTTKLVANQEKLMAAQKIEKDKLERDVKAVKEQMVDIAAQRDAIALELSGKQAELDTAAKAVSGANLELGKLKGLLGKANADIHATRDEKARIERGLQGFHAQVVLFRQEMRERMWPSLPAYFASRCAGPDISNYSECLARALVAEPSFTYTFSKKEIASALDSLRPYGKLIKAEKIRRMEEVSLRKKQLLVDCDSITAEHEKSVCRARALGRGMTIESQTQNGFPDRAWLNELLTPWLNSLPSMSTCLTLKAGSQIPDNWLDDCL